MRNIKQLILLFLIAGLTIQSSAQTILEEGFDTPGNLGNWTVVHKTGTHGNVGWTAVTNCVSPTISPFSGAGLAQLECYNISANNSYELNSPAINFSGGNYRVTFQMYRDGNSSSTLDKIEVFYNTVAGSDNGTSLGVINRSMEQDPVVTVKGWYEYTFSIPGNPNGEGYISFLGTSMYGYNICIDQVVVENIPACIKPTEIAFSNIEENQAIISWTAPSTAPANGYEYYYSTENTAPEESTTASGTTTETYINLTGLTPITNYYVWVRSVCNDTDKSAWQFGGTFKTPCGVVTASFIDNFNDVTYGQLSDCWSKIKQNTSSETGDITASYDSGTSTDLYMRISQGSDITGNYYLISPEFSDLNNTKQIIFKFRKDMSSGATDDNIGSWEIGIMTDAADTETYSTLQNISTTDLPNNHWEEIIINTTSYTGGTNGHIVFKYTAGSLTQNTFYIDDFKYQELPSCFKPVDVNSSEITASSAKISWTIPTTTPTGYEYYYSLNETDAPNASTTPLGTVTENNVTISDLESTSVYYAWVRSVCSDTDKSEWSFIHSFKTACSTYTAELTENLDSYSFGQIPDCWSTKIENATGYPDIQIDNERKVSYPLSIRMYNASDVSGTYYLISPKFSDLDNTKEISFQINRKIEGLEINPDRLYTMEVGIITDADDVNTYQVLQDITMGINLNTWKEVKVNTYNYTGGEGHLVIKMQPMEGGEHNKFFLDNFKYAEADDVSCATPLNVTCSEVTETGANISWTAPENAPANGYEYAYSTTNTTPSEGRPTTETSASLIDLQGDTDYYIWVRSVCSDTEKSEWSFVTGFTTLPEAANYTITFNVTNGISALANASITINEQTLTTNNSGVASIELEDGTYDYSISLNGYEDYTGSVTVSGADQTIDINLNAITYTITFNVTDGTNALENISIVINNQTLTTDANGQASIELADGVYPYTANANGYNEKIGSITVAGATQEVNIEMTEATAVYYTVTFNVTDGTNALGNVNIAINNQNITTASNGTTSIDLLDGTYSYTATLNGYEPLNGSVTVAGIAKTVNIEMVAITTSTYVVVFNVKGENGELIAQASININEQNIMTNDNGIATIELPNGTYHYTVETEEDKYLATEGDLTVEGQNQAVDVILGLSGISEQFKNVNLSPNPTNDWLNIVTDDIYTVEIINMNGSVLYQSKMLDNKISLNFRPYQSGVYIVRLIKDNQVANYKVIKK